MPSKKLQEYIQTAKQEKEAKAKKDKLKPYIQKLLKRCKRWGVKISGVSFYKVAPSDFVEDKLYDWVAEQVNPEILEDLTIITKTIDLEKLQQLVLEKKIDFSKLPEDCYQKKESWTIRIN